MKFELNIINLKDDNYKFTENNFILDDMERNKMYNGDIETKFFIIFPNEESYNKYIDILMGGFKKFEINILQPLNYHFIRDNLHESEYLAKSSIKNKFSALITFIR